MHWCCIHLWPPKQKGKCSLEDSRLSCTVTTPQKTSWSPGFCIVHHISFSTCFLLVSHRHKDHLHAALQKILSQVTWNYTSSEEYKHIIAYNLIKHRCGSCEGPVWVPVSYKEISIVLPLMQWWQYQPQPPVGAFCRGCMTKGRGLPPVLTALGVKVRRPDFVCA